MFGRIIKYHAVEKRNGGLARGIFLAFSLIVCVAALALMISMVL